MPVKLNGSTSGFVELKAPAVAGTTSLELPTDSIKPALVLVNETTFSAATSVSVNNCFSATYQNYRIIIVHTASAQTALNLRLRTAGSDNTTTNYARQGLSVSSTSVSGARATGTNNAELGYYGIEGNIAYIDFGQPFESAKTNWHGQLSAAPDNPFFTGFSGGFNSTTSFDGFSLLAASGTITGTVRIYGYRNSL